MKIKILLSIALLGSVLFANVAMAGNPQPPPPATPCEAPFVGDKKPCTCPSPNIETYDKGGKVANCEDGKAFCEEKKIDDSDFEYAYDPEAQMCYLNIKDVGIGQFTVLPFTRLSVAQCEDLYSQDAAGINFFKDFLNGKSGKTPKVPTTIEIEGVKSSPQTEISKLDVLGCGIKTGRMKLWMIPYYIKFFIQFALSIAGIVAVGAMVVGGYLYMFGTMMDDKERGKRSIIYGIGGFIVVLLAWAIVNVVISLATM